MKDRLERFLESESLTKAQFADTIKMARAGISHIMAGRNNPSYEFIINTMKAFPSLNIEWLLCGKGSMYKSGIADNPVPKDDIAGSLFDITYPSTVNKQEELPDIQEEKPKIQRKATKVIMIYDDGHFEEFDNFC